MLLVTGTGLNYATLTKGDYIPPTMIEAITGEVAGTPNFSLAAMNVKTTVEGVLRQRAEEEAEVDGRIWRGGCPITLKHEKDGIRLLTDPEAAEYNASRGESACKQLRAAFRRNQNVAEVNLDDSTRQKHYRTLEVQGKQVQAIRKVAVDLRVEPARRQTPGITL